MALWRDPLDDLIADLERALPASATPGRYEFLPRLEDLQAVFTPILFASKEDQQRIFADPQYQRLHATVMRQLARGKLDDVPIDPLIPHDLFEDLPDPEPSPITTALQGSVPRCLFWAYYDRLARAGQARQAPTVVERHRPDEMYVLSERPKGAKTPGTSARRRRRADLPTRRVARGSFATTG